LGRLIEVISLGAAGCWALDNLDHEFWMTIMNLFLWLSISLQTWVSL